MGATWALPCRLTVAVGCGQVANTLPKGGMSFHDWRLVHGSGKLTIPAAMQPKLERLQAAINNQASGWGYSPARGSRFEAVTNNQARVRPAEPNVSAAPRRGLAIHLCTEDSVALGGPDNEQSGANHSHWFDFDGPAAAGRGEAKL